MTRFAQLLLAASGLAILAEAAVYWGASAELLNRSPIVAVAVWLMIRARKHLVGGATRSTRIGGAVLLAIGMLAAPLAWFLVAQVGPRPVLLWWLAAAWLLGASGALLAESGWLGLKTFAFPLLFLLFVLPLPQRLEQPIQTLLQEMATSLSASLLSLLGHVVQREGFVLRLPHGDLEVLEACSGIRSAMALTAVALLLAHLRGLGLIRGSVLFALSLPVIVVANVFRVTASGVLQENVGINAIHGTPHHLLGFVSFLGGLLLLAGLSRLFRASSPLVQSVVVPSRRSSRLVAGMLALSPLASIAAALLGLNSVERFQQSAPLEQIDMSLGTWHGEEISVPAEIRDMLAFDRASHRVYHDSIGQEVHAWVIYWSGAGSVRGYHHPDVCWPNHGWSLIDKRLEQLDSGVPLSVRQYALGGRRQMLCYWTQEGSRFWSDADEESAQLEGTPGHRWIGERLVGRPVQQSGRLAVLIAADLWGSGGFAEKSLLEFCRQFAAELYRVIPWAAPPAIRRP